MPVFVTLCLSVLGCACLCYAVPIFIGLCLSLFGCAFPYWAVPVFVTLCLSLLGCACLCSAVPVRVGLCLSLLGCACLCYAVPNRVQLCWPLRVPLLFRNRILTLIPLYTYVPVIIWLCDRAMRFQSKPTFHPRSPQSPSSSVVRASVQEHGGS